MIQVNEIRSKSPSLQEDSGCQRELDDAEAHGNIMQTFTVFLPNHWHEIGLVLMLHTFIFTARFKLYPRYYSMLENWAESCRATSRAETTVTVSYLKHQPRGFNSVPLEGNKHILVLAFPPSSPHPRFLIF